ncbi:MAG: ion transporter [Chloroflexi bacterium]|nr:ion transporter [Chloroflexota bacterium]
MQTLDKVIRRVAGAPAFERFIFAVIVANGLLLGLETYPYVVDRLGVWIEIGHWSALAIFIVEFFIKVLALRPRPVRYFQDPWNIIDFCVIVIALIPLVGDIALLGRLVRLFRMLRLVTTSARLRVIVGTLIRAVPSVFFIVVLLSIIGYMYAVAGYHFFHAHDPFHWGSLAKSALTLFRVITFEGWTTIMDTAMEHSPFAWVYFVSFIVISGFVAVNLFVAAIINEWDEAERIRARELESELPYDAVIAEMRATQEALRRLEQKLEGEVERRREG